MPRHPILATPIKLFALALSGLALSLSACSLIVEDTDPEITKARLEREGVKVDGLDVDPIMRGTVAAETGLTGFNDTVVRGYGLVVGLRDTGSRTMPAEVRAYMTAELARQGYGSGKDDNTMLSPQRMLNDPNTAVVVVEGVIPPGAPKGTSFDVRVIAAPGTSTSSLEGGRLLMTSLRPGPLFTGSRQAKSLAEASGHIVINPFMEPNSLQRDSINRTSGRILDGGKVGKDMLLRLRLYTPSHARAETIQNSINSVFPREPRQRDETARGRSGDAIDLTVPPSYAKKTGEFAELIRHTPLNIENPEQSAMAIRRALLNNPGAASAASWRWQALGRKALPLFQDLYTWPEEQPRLAALDAGAKLNDMLAVPHLLNMANTSKNITFRVEAVNLMGRMGTNPEIDMGLRKLLDDNDVEVRLAAFEALDKRRDPHIVQIDLGEQFIMNVVPSNKPMIYVTQSGQPRIVVFDDSVEVARPMTIVAWDTRLIMKADEGDEYVQVRYRESANSAAIMDRVRPNLMDFVSYLGRRPSRENPEAGLGFSYSETIAAVHELWRNNYILDHVTRKRADFKAEQDRILAAVLRNDKTDETARPEFVEDVEADAPATAASLSELSGSRADIDNMVKPGLDATKPRKDTVPR